jgi:protein gp37
MGDKSRIEWTDATWNPVTGCSPVSAACDHCYAARMVKRFPHLHDTRKQRAVPLTIHPKGFWNIQFHPSRLDQPLRWKKPRRIFVCSMGDLFHEDVPTMTIYNVFTVMARCQRHTFMVLTKRPERMLEYCQRIRFIPTEELAHLKEPGVSYNPNEIHSFRPLPNLYLGVTAENQEMADQRIPILLQTPAAKRFVSIEPMLGPVDLGRIKIANGVVECAGGRLPPIDWVICGGESGPGARPMHPDWPRSLRDQCQEAGVPFFFKQWGEWAPIGTVPAHGGHALARFGTNLNPEADVVRVGKKAAGCLLDGREWKEFPR